MQARDFRNNQFVNQGKEVVENMMDKRDYRCRLSGKPCPFNDADTWEKGDARNFARNNCPIQNYEPDDAYMDGKIAVYNDWCRHLVPMRISDGE